MLNISPSDALNTIELNYSGPVVTLLDQIAARAGLYWEYTGGRILFSRVVSRTFAIKSMSPGVKTSGSITLSSSGASGDSGGSAGGGGVSIEANSETNVWANLEPTLLTMVSSTGRLQMDAPGGSVTVTDALDNVNRIERFIRQLNDSLLRQITLEVEIFQVNLNDDYSNGLSWTALASNLSRLNGGSVRISTPTPSSAASGGAFTLITGSNAGRTATAVVSALESFGRVSGVYSGVVTTVNRTPVPLGSTTSQSYLRETTPAVVSGSSLTGFTTQAGLVPGTINTGFTMVVTPTILDSNRVLVQTNLEISNLVSLDKFGTDTQSIQLPNISRFVTMQRSNMMAGETLVLTGYERQSTQTDASDVVRGVLPSSRSGKRQRESLVILITPRFQDN
jgi:type IVB pilus formation R64 PilN family outer membrane protein